MSDAFTQAFAAQRSGDIATAEQLYRELLEETPDHEAAHSNLGILLAGRKEYGEAEKHLHRAVKLSPKKVNYIFNLAELYRRTNHVERAVQCYGRCVQLNPKHQRSWSGLGKVFRKTGDTGKAARAIRNAAMLKPSAMLATEYLSLCLRSMHWEPLNEAIRMVETGIRKGEDCDPYELAQILDSPKMMRIAARAHGQAVERKAAVIRSAKHTYPERAKGERLRIGYISSDCRTHPVAHLAVQLWESHNRDRFEVFMYSTHSGAEGEVRSRIENGVEHFVDAAKLSDRELYERIQHDRIHILVDVNGYTTFGRLAVVAARPAPVQVNFLGYPGTLGSTAADYIIVDEYILTDDVRAGLTEIPVAMPVCYQPNDARRPATEHTLSRKKYGLPEEGVVMCCFNQPQKIMPDIFTLWLRILEKCPQSVLWLLEYNLDIIPQLRKKAQAAGIDPQRIIGAPRLPHAKHLARYRMADIALDTLPYNGHTTTSDALRSGCPVVTLCGKAFQGRVSASLLHALGMEELITHTATDYEKVIIDLVNNPDQLSTVRNNLQQSAAGHALFDGAEYARNLEQAFGVMWELHEKGKKPERIVLRKDGKGSAKC